jgi:hypothetical protein
VELLELLTMAGAGAVVVGLVRLEAVLDLVVLAVLMVEGVVEALIMLLKPLVEQVQFVLFGPAILVHFLQLTLGIYNEPVH